MDARRACWAVQSLRRRRGSGLQSVLEAVDALREKGLCGVMEQFHLLARLLHNLVMLW